MIFKTRQRVVYSKRLYRSKAFFLFLICSKLTRVIYGIRNKNLPQSIVVESNHQSRINQSSSSSNQHRINQSIIIESSCLASAVISPWTSSTLRWMITLRLHLSFANNALYRDVHSDERWWIRFHSATITCSRSMCFIADGLNLVY